MSRDMWDPRQYRAYEAERARPFFDLLDRVDVDAPAYVVDLGCGPGERTADLAARWPDAVVEGVDRSPQMIADAQRLADQHANGGSNRRASREPERAPGGRPPGDETDGPAPEASEAVTEDSSAAGADPARASGQDGPRLRFSVGDIADWTPERPVDVIISSAAFQWVPGHQRMLARWVDALAPGGRLAFTMPGNFDGASHVILRELCRSERWRDRLASTIRHDIVSTPAEYVELLSGLGCRVDAWETTYLQVLPGPDPVLDWMRGTALRPALDALREPAQRREFLAELGARLREAYPRGAHGTVFPFRRIFAVAARPGRAARREPSVTGIHHVQLAAPSGSEPSMREFYGALLGMAEVPKPAALASRGGAWFRAPGLELHIGIEADFRPATKAHPGILVRDLDAMAERLGAAGHRVRPDDLLPGYRRFYVDDPAGNRIELLEPTP
jgi:trans-aconitate 2-methyltransferase